MITFIQLRLLVLIENAAIQRDPKELANSNRNDWKSVCSHFATIGESRLDLVKFFICINDLKSSVGN